jgi:zinc ribbon protein
MSQNPSRPCQQCGTSLPLGQQFCSNCGATQNIARYEPTAMSQSTPPPPPNVFPQQVQQHQQSQSDQPWQPTQQNRPGTAPVYAQAPKKSGRKLLGGIGCAVLVILLLLGTGGYFLFHYVSGLGKSITSGSTTTSGTNNGTTNGTTNSTQPTIKTTLINLTVTYAEVATTVVDAKLSQKFIDDSATSGSSVLRIDLNEQNKATTSTAGYLYSDVTRLLLPGGQSIAPGNTKLGTSPQKQTSQTNWLDFPVPASLNVSQAILELGTSTQAKMDIPLKTGSDISKYQLRTVSPNAILHYAGINWTITTAIASFSADATQAATGMRYVTLTLTADNPTSQALRGILSDYMRLQAGSATSTPVGDSTFPLSVEANTTGTTGTAIFIVPEGTTSYTFILLANPNNQYTQATVGFQIP